MKISESVNIILSGKSNLYGIEKKFYADTICTPDQRILGTFSSSENESLLIGLYNWKKLEFWTIKNITDNLEILVYNFNLEEESNHLKGNVAQFNFYNSYGDILNSMMPHLIAAQNVIGNARNYFLSDISIEDIRIMCNRNLMKTVSKKGNNNASLELKFQEERKIAI